MPIPLRLSIVTLRDAHCSLLEHLNLRYVVEAAMSSFVRLMSTVQGGIWVDEAGIWVDEGDIWVDEACWAVLRLGLG